MERLPPDFSDTGGYLDRPILGTLGMGRSALYGLFLYTASHSRSGRGEQHQAAFYRMREDDDDVMPRSFQGSEVGSSHFKVVLTIGTRSANSIMASGHIRRTNRPELPTLAVASPP